AGPGITNGEQCSKPVQLLDLYPTLLALTGHEPDPIHEGHSLVPLLENPNAHWPHMAITSFGPGNTAVRSERYRYIRYHDSSEELYDPSEDPNEWNNLISDPTMDAIVEAHRMSLPDNFHPVLGDGSTGHESYNAANSRIPDAD